MALDIGSPGALRGCYRGGDSNHKEAPLTERGEELRVATQAVRAAARVCAAVQRELVQADSYEKKDKSPVTVADYASQAVVCAHLSRALPKDRVVGEEDAAELRGEKVEVRRRVVDRVAYTGAVRSGASFSLDPSALDADLNDAEASFCYGVDVYSGTGSYQDKGTPGAPNPPCMP